MSDIERIFAAQKHHRHAVRATSAAERGVKLRALRAAVLSHLPEAIAALNEDFGKPGVEAATEGFAILAEIDDALAHLEQWMQPIEVTPSAYAAAGAKARIIREPKGQVLIFGPWNFPFSLLLQPLVGAVAAGNVCMLKPSELTPAIGAVSARIVRAVFDEAEVAIVEGGPEVAAALLELPFDHIFFTGSTKVGKLVMAAAAQHLSSLTLELGGKSPAIVDSEVDLAQAAARIAWGKYLNAGQICLSPDHVWIRAAQRDAFVEHVAAYVRTSLYAGGALVETDYGQIVNPRNLQRLTGLIDDAVSRGARIALGGRALASRRIEPTVLIDVPRDAAIMQEEIFGPILPVLTYSDLDDVLAEIERRGKPLALYVFSQRAGFIDTVLSRTSSGGVTVNDVLQHCAEPALPFGGVGPSGMGVYHGVHTFLAFTHERSVYHQAEVNPREAFSRPPYAGKLEVLTKKLRLGRM
jgi:aldehyde dehydrogenase (NAD+)